MLMVTLNNDNQQHNVLSSAPCEYFLVLSLQFVSNQCKRMTSSQPGVLSHTMEVVCTVGRRGPPPDGLCWTMIRHHPTTITTKYQAMVHVGSVRQSAAILHIDVSANMCIERGGFDQ